jgi:hypothetical protein
MSSTKSTFSDAEFDELVARLRMRLTAALEKELRDCALPELGKDADSDLWDLPTVDSKTVCKLSPVVQEVVGRSLKPSWVRKGGYKNVEEAIEHVIAQLRANCVLDVDTFVSTN